MPRDRLTLRFASQEHDNRLSSEEVSKLLGSTLLRVDQFLPEQGYDKAIYSQKGWTVTRYPIDPKRSRFTVVDKNNKPLAEKIIEHSELPKVLMIDDFQRKTVHLSSQSHYPDITHGDVVLAFARRQQPFAEYHLIDFLEDNGFKKNLAQVISSLPPGSFMNLCVGQEISGDQLSSLLGKEVSPKTISRYFPKIRDIILKDTKKDEEFFKKLYENFQTWQKAINPSLQEKSIQSEYHKALTKLKTFERDYLKNIELLTRHHLPVFMALPNRDNKYTGLMAAKGLKRVVSSFNSVLEALLNDIFPTKIKNAIQERGEYSIKTYGKGLNVTDTLHPYIDIPKEQLSITREQPIITIYKGKPLSSFLISDKEFEILKNLLEETEYLHYFENSHPENDQPSEYREENGTIFYYRNMQELFLILVKTRAPNLADKLLSAAQYEELYKKESILGSFLPHHPHQYVSLAYLDHPFEVDSAGNLKPPAPKKTSSSIAGNSFATPTAAGKASLEMFLKHHFSELFKKAR